MLILNTIKVKRRQGELTRYYLMDATVSVCYMTADVVHLTTD